MYSRNTHANIPLHRLTSVRHIHTDAELCPIPDPFTFSPLSLCVHHWSMLSAGPRIHKRHHHPTKIWWMLLAWHGRLSVTNYIPKHDRQVYKYTRLRFELMHLAITSLFQQENCRCSWPEVKLTCLASLSQLCSCLHCWRVSFLASASWTTRCLFFLTSPRVASTYWIPGV